MESLVNYSSEDEREDSPNRNAAARCPALEIDANKRSKGDSSRRSREESTRSGPNDRSQCSSQRDKDVSHSGIRKTSHKEENSRGSAGRFTGNRDHYHRSDRRSDRAYDKRRDPKDDRKRKGGHRDRDRDYEYRDADRDRRDRSDTHRRERHDKDNTHRDKERRQRSESPPTQSKDRNQSTNYRSRNRSRSHSPSKEYQSSYNKTNAASPTAEHALKAGKQPTLEQKEEFISEPSISQSKIATNLQAALSLPLNDVPLKMPNPNNKTEATPIALPTYYNPNIINPTKYAEQVQKRKLIWGAKKAEDTAAKWGHATFSEDSDGKVANKFMRLMGIKSTPKPEESGPSTNPVEKTGPDVKSRQAMFSNMEQQYEVARQVTHTMRGVGLGFGSQSRQY